MGLVFREGSDGGLGGAQVVGRRQQELGAAHSRRNRDLVEQLHRFIDEDWKRFFCPEYRYAAANVSRNG